MDFSIINSSFHAENLRFISLHFFIKAAGFGPSAALFAHLPKPDVGKLVLGRNFYALAVILRRSAFFAQPLAYRAQIVINLLGQGSIWPVAQGFHKVPPRLVLPPQRGHAHAQRIPGHGIGLVSQQGKLVFLNRAKNIAKAVAPVGADVERQHCAGVVAHVPL